MNSESETKKYESSCEKVNYLIRPAKQVERKLIIETLLSLKMAYNIEKYQYVGMGSLFYVDYHMFHKFLGISDMISMEMEEDKIDRFDFNKPYDFIELLSGISTNLLQTLDWEKELFIWLDYDSEISQTTTTDLQVICKKIKKGGILIITLDAKPEKFESSEKNPNDSAYKDRLNNFKSAMYPFFPFDIKERDLSLKRLPLLYREILLNVINDELKKRDLKFYQTFNFIYKDTTPMYTFGGIFEEDPNLLNNSGLFDLDFISRSNKIVEINLPIITPLEKICIDQLIPNISEKLSNLFLSKKQLNDYEKYYKYYPQYFESLI